MPSVTRSANATDINCRSVARTIHWSIGTDGGCAVRSICRRCDRRHNVWRANTTLPVFKRPVHRVDQPCARVRACELIGSNPIRLIDDDQQCSEQVQRLAIEVEANGFLYNMVRNIVGSLVEVGRGKYPATWIDDVIAAQNRDVAGPTAPPQGLFLQRVDYPVFES